MIFFSPADGFVRRGARGLFTRVGVSEILGGCGKTAEGIHATSFGLVVFLPGEQGPDLIYIVPCTPYSNRERQTLPEVVERVLCNLVCPANPAMSCTLSLTTDAFLFCEMVEST